MSTLDDQPTGGASDNPASPGAPPATSVPFDPARRTERACERCGGSHTSRQRCPLDPPPTAWEPTPSDERLSAALQREAVSSHGEARSTAVWPSARPSGELAYQYRPTAYRPA